MRSYCNGGALLVGEVLEVPTDEALGRYGDNPVVVESAHRQKQLTELMESIEGFYSVENDIRSGGEPTAIAGHLQEWTDFIRSSIVRREDFLEAVLVFERAIVDGASPSTGFRGDRAAATSAIHSVLWEERCKAANAAIGEMNALDQFWLLLNRTAMYAFYDDSYWFPEDETTANEQGFPFYLP